MNVQLVKPLLVWNKEQFLILSLFLIPLVGACFAFPLKYISNANVLIGFGLIMYVVQFQGKCRLNYIYAGLMALFSAIAFVYSVRVFYFLSLGFYFLFLFEMLKGKVNHLALLLLFFMSPVFQQVAVTFGFPIRLMLSHWAGGLLLAGGWNVKVQGNVMILNGADFSVDDACMGLNMLAMSMLMGVFLIANRYKAVGKTLGFMPLAGFFMLTFILNIGSNMVRIMLLVIFKILPENPLHEIVGIACLLGYVVVPLWFCSKWLVNYCGKTSNIALSGNLLSGNRILYILPLATLLSLAGIRIGQKRENAVNQHASVNLPALKETKLEDGISKFQNEAVLLYVKPIPEFFTGEHTPLICWKGSGYSFTSIKKQTIAGYEIYTGRLSKPGSKLYTAWWFDNGEVKTIDQLDWRIRMLKGERRFSLISVTSEDESVLLMNIESVIQKRILN